MSPYISETIQISEKELCARYHDISDLSTTIISAFMLLRRRSPVYRTDRRHLCTTRWVRGTASRGSVSVSGDCI